MSLIVTISFSEKLSVTKDELIMYGQSYTIYILITTDNYSILWRANESALAASWDMWHDSIREHVDA